jgi:phosphate transport system substrate-binding protein
MRVRLGWQWAALVVVAMAGDAVNAQGGATRLCLSGSNTVGQKLAPALVKAWAAQQGWTLGGQASPALDELRLTLKTPRGDLAVDVLAHGTSTGFAALRDGDCDLWMASRAVKSDEVEDARLLGPLYEQGQEHVIALDGLAVIVHPSNRLSALNVEQVRSVFSGRVSDWSQVGGAAGPIALHARDDRSGTFDTFKSLVLGEAALSGSAARYESTEQLAAAVAADPRAIGFVGLAGVGRAKALALSERGTVPMAPTPLSVATEDYLLARRLFLYSAARPRAEARALLDFALGPSGQQVVSEVGFVPQDIRALAQPAPTHDEYRALVSGARRLSLNFRFGEGAAVLDNKAVEDIERLARFMQAPGQKGHELLLVGFADRSESTPYLALSLSNDRVDLVAAELRAKGMRVSRQRGLGQIAPVASNDSAQGRLRNRRVEVWVRPIAGLSTSSASRPAPAGHPASTLRTSGR